MKTPSFFLAALIALAAVRVFGSAYVVYVADLVMVYALLAVGLNILIGYCGQVSVGHAAFFGIGAYVSAILSVDHGFTFWTALPVAAAAACSAGILLGLPALRAKGHYLILVTLGFGEIVRLVLQNWQPVTKGPAGITGIPPVNIAGWAVTRSQDFFFVALAFLAIGFVVARRITVSRIGKEMISVRENELAAELMGVRTMKVKLFAFACSAGFAGVAGALYAHMGGYISPDVFTLELSIAVLIMVMLGGAGTSMGPLVGAAVLTVLPELLRDFKSLYLLFYGIGILLLAVFFPRGLAGAFQRWAR
jgi:branched-chain amino acid transport system permease protein